MKIRPNLTTNHRNHAGLRWCPGAAGINSHWASEDSFTSHPANADGRKSICKGCASADQRMRLYGVTDDAYRLAKAFQGLRCAICAEESPLTIDHNHKNGVARGLLCNRCNLALGWLDDSVKNAVDLFCYADGEDDGELNRRLKTAGSLFRWELINISRAVMYLQEDGLDSVVKSLLRRSA